MKFIFLITCDETEMHLVLNWANFKFFVPITWSYEQNQIPTQHLYEPWSSQLHHAHLYLQFLVLWAVAGRYIGQWANT